MPSKILELFSGLTPFRDRLVLAGGYAVNAHGYTRNTLDIDFVCPESALTGIRQRLNKLGYSNVEQNGLVVYCQHPEEGYRVDLLPLDGETFLKLQQAAEEVDMGDGVLSSVLSLEHLLCMKIHALNQQEAVRWDKDLPDISWLCILNGLDPEQDLKPLCIKYGTETLYDQISDHIRKLQS